jgi:beta-galactosidase/beta-glucuronidase
MKCYQPDYPRPQFVRKPESWRILNGSWNFAFDDRNEGESRAWFRRFPDERREIQVPFTCEYPASGIGDSTRHDVVWYERKISIEKKQGRRIFLHFEGSDYLTKVWVNGVYAGEHAGAFARFSFDITNPAKNGENNITVRAQDSFDTCQCRGKQRWMDENFGCWYIQNTGIWKTVWIEYAPEARIGGVKMTPILDEKRLDIEAEICLPSGGGGYTFEAEASYKGTFVNRVSLPAEGNRLRFSLDIASTTLHQWGMLAWSPAHPHLYDISFTLKRKGLVADEVDSYFGMREIRIYGSTVLLNGAPLYQRLILDQGYWKDSGLTPPDEQALIADIDKVMAAGYNGVRKHQKVEDERFLYWADVKGLLVWSEMAAAYEFSDNAVSAFTREWMEIVRQNYNHPSIIVWTPFNESWGIPQIMTNRPQQQFTEAIYHLTKTYDPFRPVICNDGWENTVSDIVTLHDYEEKGEDFLERYENYLDEMLENERSHNKHRFAFAQGYRYRGQPVIISEFGGIAFNNRGEGWGYGNKVDTKEDFIRRFDGITTAIKRLDLACGYCYTQVTDVQQEINGIMDMDRNFKVEPEILREINLRKTGGLR